MLDAIQTAEPSTSAVRTAIRLVRVIETAEFPSSSVAAAVDILSTVGTTKRLKSTVRALFNEIKNKTFEKVKKKPQTGILVVAVVVGRVGAMHSGL